MTRQEQNNIIIQSCIAEITDQDNVAQRVGSAFANWFQALLAPPQQEVQDAAQSGSPANAS